MFTHRTWHGGFAALTIFALSIAAQANDLLIMNGQDILRFNGSTGAYIGKFASFTNTGYSMTYGPDGNLYVGTSRSIFRYDGQTGALLNILVQGGTNGLTPPPLDMTFGPDGNLYVAGGTNSVRRYNGTTGAFIDNFAQSSNSFATQRGLTFGADGNLYISDGFYVDLYNGTTGAFLKHFTTGGGLENAEHVAFGPDGNLYVHGNSLMKFNGSTGAGINTSSFISVRDFVFGADQKLYGLTFSGVDRYELTGALINHFVPAGSGGLLGPRDIVFMVPEPGIPFSLGILAMINLARRRRW